MTNLLFSDHAAFPPLSVSPPLYYVCVEGLSPTLSEMQGMSKANAKYIIQTYGSSNDLFKASFLNTGCVHFCGIGIFILLQYLHIT